MKELQTDVDRWSDLGNYRESWNERTGILLNMVPYSAKTIIEFGAGNGYLKTILRDGMEYTPSDIISRGAGTVIQDLNESPYDFIDKRYDVVLLSGVLEYILPLKEFVDYMSTFTNCVVCSYADTTHVERSKKEGWLNFFTQSELQLMFLKLGFSLTRKGRWKGQTLYTFTKKD